MNTEIMSQWLKAFYIHVGTERKILLTIDNFSAYESAVEDCLPPSNVQILFLPLNSTAQYQPLD
jgi:DDE superfamily endonuclease